jgi:hypothetical protein
MSQGSAAALSQVWTVLLKQQQQQLLLVVAWGRSRKFLARPNGNGSNGRYQHSSSSNSKWLAWLSTRCLHAQPQQMMQQATARCLQVVHQTANQVWPLARTHSSSGMVQGNSSM